jgi:hypothetical protein
MSANESQNGPGSRYLMAMCPILMSMDYDQTTWRRPVTELFSRVRRTKDTEVIIPSASGSFVDLYLGCVASLEKKIHERPQILCPKHTRATLQHMKMLAKAISFPFA